MLTFKWKCLATIQIIKEYNMKEKKLIITRDLRKHFFIMMTARFGEYLIRKHKYICKYRHTYIYPCKNNVNQLTVDMIELRIFGQQVQ